MNIDQEYTPIDRDRGAAYVAYTGRPDHAVVRLQFQERYGYEPADVFEDGPYTMVGPAPERVEDIDLYDWEDDNDQQ